MSMTREQHEAEIVRILTSEYSYSDEAASQEAKAAVDGWLEDAKVEWGAEGYD